MGAAPGPTFFALYFSWDVKLRWCVKKVTLALLPQLYLFFFFLRKIKQKNLATDITQIHDVRRHHKPIFYNIYDETSKRESRYTNSRAGPDAFRSRVTHLNAALPEPLHDLHADWIMSQWELTCYIYFVCSFSPTPYYDPSPLTVSFPHWPLLYSAREICTEGAQT